MPQLQSQSHNSSLAPMLFGLSIVTNISPMFPIHGEQAAQVGHPIALQLFQSGVVLIFGSRIVHLVLTHNSQMGQMGQVLLRYNRRWPKKYLNVLKRLGNMKGDDTDITNDTRRY